MSLKPTSPVSKGMKDVQDLLKQWNSTSNPPKVYIMGYRVHHGLVGLITGLYALDKGNGYLFGASLAAFLDDIYDAPNWLDFEKGGNPNSLIDLV